MVISIARMLAEAAATRGVRVLVRTVLMCALAAGCASASGGQSPSVDTRRFLAAHDGFINGDVVKEFHDADDKAVSKGLTARQEYRNSVIDARIAAADIHYDEFVRRLTSQRNVIGLGTSLAAIGLSGGASVAAATTAHALSAAALGFTGAGTAFNTQLFAAKTVQVLVTQMDANRGQVLVRLIGGERLTAAGYSMGQALADLADYEGAGSLDRALGEVSKAATTAKAKADGDVKALAIGLVDPKVEDRKKAFTNKIWDLTDANDVTTLKAIAAALKLPALKEPVAAKDLKNEILPELDRRVGAQDATQGGAQADSIDALLKPILAAAPAHKDS